MCVEDLTKELWQGVSERLNQPEPMYQPPLLVAEPPLPVADRTSWRDFLVSRTMAAILALGCALGLIAIINASPFASTSVAERVSDKLGQPATCVQHAATVTADHPSDDLQMHCWQQNAGRRSVLRGLRPRNPAAGR